LKDVDLLLGEGGMLGDSGRVVQLIFSPVSQSRWVTILLRIGCSLFGPAPLPEAELDYT
jgi:hypothetical protein